MSDQSTSQTSADGKKEEPVFEPADLVERASEFFADEGHPAHVVAGALHDRQKPLTLAEARKKIATWLGRDVPEDIAEEAR